MTIDTTDAWAQTMSALADGAEPEPEAVAVRHGQYAGLGWSIVSGGDSASPAPS